MKTGLPPDIEERIFEIRREGRLRITSYFPLSEAERGTVTGLLGPAEFRSIFSDVPTEEQWQRSKGQIRKKFQSELFGIGRP